MPLLVQPVLSTGSLGRHPQPRISGTAGLTLRPFTVDDVPRLVAAYADPEIQRWHCRTLDDTEATILVRQWRDSWASETSASWAVTGPDGDRLVGRISFRAVDLSSGVAEVGYWVLPGARGQGVAPAAVRALSGWAFGAAGLQRLELRHSTRNEPSCRVAARAGFTPEGVLRAAVLHTDGWHDMHLHSRLHSDHPPASPAPAPAPA